MTGTIKLTYKGAEELERKLTSLVDLDDHIEREAADQICEVMRNTAVERLTDQGAVDTGLLRNSLMADDGYNSFTERPASGVVSAGIRTDVNHAIFIEYGTGPKGDPAIPHTSKRIWFQQNPEYDALYPDDDPRSQAWIPRFPQAPRPFMRPALYDNRKVFNKILTDTVVKVFEEA